MSAVPQTTGQAIVTGVSLVVKVYLIITGIIFIIIIGIAIYMYAKSRAGQGIGIEHKEIL